MAEMMTTDVRAIMDRSPFDVAAVADLREVLNRDPSRYRTLREAVANIRDREKREKENKPETHLRLGVGEVLLGRYQSGLEHLKKAGDVGMAFFFRGLAIGCLCEGRLALTRGCVVHRERPAPIGCGTPACRHGPAGHKML